MRHYHLFSDVVKASFLEVLSAYLLESNYEIAVSNDLNIMNVELLQQVMTHENTNEKHFSKTVACSKVVCEEFLEFNNQFDFLIRQHAFVDKNSHALTFDVDSLYVLNDIENHIILLDDLFFLLNNFRISKYAMQMKSVCYPKVCK